MACKVCGSGKKKVFASEINIHPPRGLEHLSSPCVFGFPKMFVCLDCGLTEFVLNESERSELAQNYGDENLAAGQQSDGGITRDRRIAASKYN